MLTTETQSQQNQQRRRCVATAADPVNTANMPRKTQLYSVENAKTNNSDNFQHFYAIFENYDKNIQLHLFSIILFNSYETIPSVLWHCWLGVR